MVLRTRLPECFALPQTRPARRTFSNLSSTRMLADIAPLYLFRSIRHRRAGLHAFYGFARSFCGLLPIELIEERSDLSQLTSRSSGRGWRYRTRAES